MSGEPNANPSDLTPLKSDLVNDPELADLVEFFLSELDDRARTIRTALESDDTDCLRRIAHQLKGAAGGYGFPQIGDAAGDLEQSTMAAEADLSEIHERVEALLLLCRRAAMGATTA